MADPFRVIAFDGDDTLWHCESIYSLAEGRLQALLEPFLRSEEVKRRLYEVEMRNLRVYGYGAKGFTLSMIETALEVTEGRITGKQVADILEIGHFVMKHPVEPLEGAREALEELARARPLALLTKGDLFDQEAKLAQSNLAELFTHVEIVSAKDAATYDRVLRRLGVAPRELVMVGNSLHSDVLPVLELGGWAIHVPYHVTWQHEVAGLPEGPHQERFAQVPSIRDVPGALKLFTQRVTPA
jgi:putative hydrolase of the HAD superfamily